MVNTRRKAKPQGRVKRAAQRYKKAMRHRYADHQITDTFTCPKGRYACINLKGETIERFKDAHMAYAYCVAGMASMNFCTVEDLGELWEFVPALTVVR